MELSVIARVRNDFTAKFGIPRQSGLAEKVESRVVLEPEYKNPDALRGLEGFSHIWLIWGFDRAKRDGWSPTVRPPRLGGNERMGVFATRSPFRPNSLGLSCVRLLAVDRERCELLISGADMADMTPVYDIKPYIKYADSKADALGGWTDSVPERGVEVVFPKELLDILPAPKRQAAVEILSMDPRPTYQDDPERVYGMEYGGFDIRFTVKNGTLEVREVLEKGGENGHKLT